MNLVDRIKTLEEEMEGMLQYRLLFNLLLIGEASSELLEAKSKPKSAIKRPGDPVIIWDSTPKKKQLRPIDDKLRNLMIDWKDSKNFLSHLMKQKRADPTYLQVIVEDTIQTKNKIGSDGIANFRVVSEESLKALENNKSNF